MVRRQRVLELNRLFGLAPRADGDISGDNRSFTKRNEPMILSNPWLRPVLADL
jgi:hypothetical protein